MSQSVDCRVTGVLAKKEDSARTFPRPLLEACSEVEPCHLNYNRLSDTYFFYKPSFRVTALGKQWLGSEGLWNL